MNLEPESHPSTILHEQLRYQGKKYTFVAQHMRFPGGKEGLRDYLLHPGGSMAVPLTAAGNYLCLRQYRFAVGSYIYEFPAGTLEPNESPDETIKRELEEETGYRALQWDSLGSFYLAPGYSDEIMSVFLARELVQLPDPPAQDDDEDIQVVELSSTEMLQLAFKDLALDAKSIAAFYRAQLFLTAL